MQKWIDLAEEQRKNYRSALEEIREIIKQDCRECEFNNDSICCEIGDCEAGKLQIIQNKINGVLNDN